MLPEPLAAHLSHFTQLLAQPINRWEGFDLSAPASHSDTLREQILYASWALTGLGAHPEADAEERAQAATGLRAGIERLIQRRVWAAWAGATEQAGEIADPVASGYAAYSGALATLLGLATTLGEQPYADNALTLRWSHDSVFSYNHAQLLRMLAAQMRADYGGAIACTDATTTPTAMALVLWGLQLGTGVIEAEQSSAGARWLQTVRGQLALRGPRLPGRGALAASYHLRRRRAALLSDPLEDAMALALLAPLEPELTRELARRHWPAVAQPERVSSTLVLAFSALLALALAEPERALQLSEAAAARPDSTNPWPRALLALIACGGLASVAPIASADPTGAHVPSEERLAEPDSST
jgi:hypothetical protein